MQDFVIALLTWSITMSVLVLLYMMATPLLAKHYSEKGRYYTWLAIVISLIIPFRPQWDNALIVIDIQSETAMPSVLIGNEIPVTIPVVMPINAATLSPATLSMSWWQIAAEVWLAGMIIFLAYHLIKHYYFVKMIRHWSEKITDEQVLTLFQDIKKEMGTTKKIELYLCSCINSPMMIGLVNPKIFLPPVTFTKNEIRFILKHELVHHNRNDLLYKHLILVATAVHWFNPVVYVMAKAISELCEVSCDAEVVRNADMDTRYDYSETIINVAKYHLNMKTTFSTHFYGGKKGIEKRITSIMDTSQKKGGNVIICMVIAATIAIGFAVATPVNVAETAEFSSTYANEGQLDVIVSGDELIRTWGQRTTSIGEPMKIRQGVLIR